ncbi:MAG: serine/threonine-protein kinase, partial [Planctomycetota bacterium]|nr:serine/threonine-protein kinase [Planctomycetota bacterium]
MPQDSYSENQGRLVIERHWASREQVSYAWQALAASPQLDLCGLLIQIGQIDMAQAMEIRSMLGQASEQTVLGQSSPLQSTQATVLGQSSQAILSIPSTNQHSAPTLPPGSINESTVLGQLSPNQSQEKVAHLSQSSSGEFNISIPGYEVVKEIGRGGMGAVFLVNEEGSQTPCVAKVMLNADMGEEAYVRFKREARALAKLKHENIVAIKTFGEINGYPYFIMEHIVGRELKEHIEENLKQSGSAPPLDDVLELLTPVARALTYAHKKQIVHRDLKPANILIESGSERPIILDYGLAKSENQDLSESLSNGENLTKTGQALGTPAYMAPEQLDLSSQSGTQPANDVWGFAATLFFALTGQPPYVGPTPINIYNQLLRNSPPVLSDLNPNMPLWLEQLCELCFQRDMEQRPTMAAVLRALETRDSSGLNLKLTKAAKRKRLQKSALIALAFLVFIAISAGVYIALKPVEKDLEVLFIEDIPSRSRSPILKFSVKTNFEPNLIEVSATLNTGAEGKNEVKQKIVLSPENGIFRGEFSDIENGRYTVKVIVQPKGDEADVIPKEILVDQTPPSFNRVSVTAEGLLTGELSEDHCVVQWNSQNITVEKRQFKIQLDPFTLSNREALVVTDQVGHRLKLKQMPFHIVRAG